MSWTPSLSAAIEKLTAADRELFELLLRRDEAQLPPLRPSARGEPAPLSTQQRAAWLRQRRNPSSLAYLQSRSLVLQGRLDVRAFETSLRQIIDRHDMLRTIFAVRDGVPVQIVNPDWSFALPVVDLGGEADPQAAARAHASADAALPIDLTAGPLIRLKLLRLSPEQHVLLLSTHHIATDAWSTDVFCRELAVLYEANTARRAMPLPPLPIQYADYARWEHELFLDETLTAAWLSYWRSELSDLALLPLRRGTAANQGGPAATIRVSLPSSILERVKRIATAEGGTIFSALAGALVVALRWYSEGPDVTLLAVPVSGRDRPELEPLIGLLVNLIVLRSRESDSVPFGSLVQRLHRTKADAIRHRYPIDLLTASIRGSRDLAQAIPLFRVMFNVINSPTPRLKIGTLDVTAWHWPDTTSRYDLNVRCWESAAGLDVDLVYDTVSLGADDAHQIGAALVAVLTRVAEAPSTSIFDLVASLG